MPLTQEGRSPLCLTLFTDLTSGCHIIIIACYWRRHGERVTLEHP